MTHAATSSASPTGRAAVAVRDQSESSFAAILAGLVARVVGARAAALVDPLGETVDYSGEGPPDEIRIAAAHWGIVLYELRAQKSFATVSSFVIMAEHASFLVQALPDGYALVVRLAAELELFRFERALAVASLAMAREAGWAFERTPTWRSIEVVVDARERPIAVKIGDALQPIELLGRYAEPAEGPGDQAERAWRVRVAFGAETMLVREPSGFWYADEPLEELAQRRNRATKAPPEAGPHIFQTTGLTGKGS
jgi:hypothetical protein